MIPARTRKSEQKRSDRCIIRGLNRPDSRMRPARTRPLGLDPRRRRCAKHRAITRYSRRSFDSRPRRAGRHGFWGLGSIGSARNSCRRIRPCGSAGSGRRWFEPQEVDLRSKGSRSGSPDRRRRVVRIAIRQVPRRTADSGARARKSNGIATILHLVCRESRPWPRNLPDCVRLNRCQPTPPSGRITGTHGKRWRNTTLASIPAGPTPTP